MIFDVTFLSTVHRAMQTLAFLLYVLCFYHIAHKTVYYFFIFPLWFEFSIKEGMEYENE